MKAPIFLFGLALALGACGPAPVANEANEANALDEPMEIETLPPDESVAAPTNALANGAANSAAVEQVGGPIPASMHGRWALTAGDCLRPVGGSEGSLFVTANELRFYESVARPAADVRMTANSISGDFAFSGEGERWTRRMELEIEGDRLVRTQSEPAARTTYARCE